MTKKIIEIKQVNKIECDSCEFFILNENPNKLSNVDEYVNKPCPKCGANLLTPHDYKDYLKFIQLVNRANRWLGWLSYFFGKQTVDISSKTIVKVHDGIYINNK